MCTMSVVKSTSICLRLSFMGQHHLSFERMLCQVVNISCTSSENFQLLFRKEFSAMSTSF